MTKRVLSAAAAAALVLAFATGCGDDGDGGGRPSVDEISKSLQDNDMFGDGVDDKIADCVAKEFHDSDLSDDALQALVDNDKDYEGTDEDKDALSSVSSESIAECAGADLPDTEDLPDAETDSPEE